MCLSTVYKNEKTPENEILKNVMTITCENGFVTLTDILGREAVVEGDDVPYAIFSTDGTEAASGVAKGRTTIPLPAGIYVARIGGTSRRIAVR